MMTRIPKPIAPLVLSVFAFTATTFAQQIQPAIKAVQVTGMPRIKENAKGMLSVENGNLHFICRKSSADIGTSSIQNVVTGSDSEKAVGKTVGTLSMAAPYGGGRFLSLFRTKIDTLTVEYRDTDGAFHGSIFTMPAGTADGVKKELIAQGAHSELAAQPQANAQDSSNGEAGGEQAKAHKATAIQLAVIQSEGVSVPAEFQIALYENLVRQLEKRGFQHVYRDGDRNAAAVPGLVVLHSTVQRFKPGSEKARQVTTVAGATSITIHCQFTDAEGRPLLERDVTGKVRFFGGNLRATYDFAKKASRIANESFGSSNGK